MSTATIPLVRRRDDNTIVLRQPTPSKIALRLTFIVLITVTVYGFLTIDTRGTNLSEAAAETVEYFGLMFGRPAASEHLSFGHALRQVLITLALAFMTTVIGAVIALVLGLAAARNLTNQRVSNVIKGFIAFIRAIPTVLWVLIFAIGAGLGAVAAVIGMSFHTVGHLLKSYSESFEELDEGVIEALRASGASWIQIVFQAVLPSSVTYILSWTFIRFEINFAVAVAMGAAAGAGGIGFELVMASAFRYDIQEIGYITYLILAVVVIMEVMATRLKRRYHIHD
ncbi:MAG: PhnE/PtxC family ABC transporter permease [Spirochaetota bacterium]